MSAGGADPGAPGRADGARSPTPAPAGESVWFTGWNPTPELLDLASAPDPFQVQPGGIIAERFCVIGRVRHSSDGWRVPVTDLSRRAGAPPHHRLVLHRLRWSTEAPDAAKRLFAAIVAHQRDTRRVVAMAAVPDGALVVSVPADGPAMRLPLTDPEASAVVRNLCGALRELHRSGYAGVRYDLRELRLDGGRVQFGSWRHLLDAVAGTPDARDADVAAMVATLRQLGTRRVHAVLDEVQAASPADALDRLITACDPSPAPSDDALPSEAPFVGRQDALARLADLVDGARADTPGWAWVSGPPGIGRSRLLAQAAAESVTDDRLVVHVAFRPGMPTTGLGLLLDAAAAAIGRLAPSEREQLATRIRRAVGAQLPVVRQASPRLADLLGDIERTIVDIPLQERFLRHAGVLADLLAAVGTPERVLLVLLDDVHLADAGVRAVLWNLLSPGRRHHTSIVVTAPTAPDLGRTPGPVSDQGPVVLAGRPPEHLALAPFTPGEVDRWTRSLFGTSGAELVSWALFQDTDGIPGAMWERVRTWLETRALEVGPSGSVALRPPEPPPAAPSEPNLSSDARALGACCVVRAEQVGPFWLSEVTGWPPARVRAAVGELTHSGLVQHPSGLLGWRDERARQRFADEDPAAVAAAHATVARWLEQVDPESTLVQRAWHLEHALPAGLHPSLAELHLRAGSVQLAHANVERAAWHFSQVVGRSADPDVLRRARRGFADAELLQNHVESALAAYLDAMSRSDAAEAVELANEAVSAFYLRGSHGSIVTLADRSLSRVGARLPRGWAEALVQVVGALATWAVRALLRRPATDPLADRLALLHTWLVASLGVTHPWVALASMVRGSAVTALRHSGEAARARAFLAPVVAAASPRWALAMLATSEKDTRGDPLNHAVVLHMRGQTELSLGLYADGQASMQKAVAGFRQAGDLSTGVITLAMMVFYALDRDPTRELLDRLDQALATAYRQRNEAILKNLQSMRIWVRVRAGDLSGDRLDRDLEALVPGDPMQDVVADSLTALALLHDERPGEALVRAREAAAARERLSVKPPFMDCVAVPIVLALLALGRTDEAERELATLRRTTRGNPTVAGWVRLCEARVLVHQGRTDAALELLRTLIAQAAVHGERWHVLTAHRWMAELLAGRDPNSVSAHRSLASELARLLQVRGAAPDPVDPAPHAPPPPVPDDEVDVRWLLENLRATLVPALPGGIPLELVCTLGLPVPDPRDVFELLVVNLVLAARDGAPRALAYELRAEEVDLDPERAAELADGTPGRWLSIGIHARGAPLQAPRGATRECRDLGGVLGGYLHVDGDSAIVVYLPSQDRRAASPASPPERAPRGTAGVLCADERLARTLVSELVRLGWAALTLSAGDAIPAEVTVLLAEEDLVAEITQVNARLIPVKPRSSPAAPGVLRVPFVVGELEAVLRAP